MNLFCLRGKKWLGFSVSMIIGFRDSKRKEEGCALYSSGLLPSLLLSSAKSPLALSYPSPHFGGARRRRRRRFGGALFWWVDESKEEEEEEEEEEEAFSRNRRHPKS